MAPELVRFQWCLTQGVGTGFVHITFGLRVVIADDAIALHVGLIFTELLLQWNRRLRGEQEAEKGDSE